MRAEDRVVVTRLLHLNGPPGIGKSTIARRYVDAHPGVLNCDVDVLRSLIGGWDRDFRTAGALIRPAALAMIGAYLANGHDVVLPQLLVDADELTRFETCATEVGAQFVERVLMDEPAAAVDRFHRRGSSAAQDPWPAAETRR
jgi:predicted kinase